LLQGTLHHLLCVVGSAVTLSACGGEVAPERPTIEWNEVAWSQGTLNVALVRPTDGSPGPHPVILALPWGSGSTELVASFVYSYWLTEPASRGYYVVAPEVRGSSLVDTADDIIPALFEWMDRELDIDQARVALVGASNGGRGMFFAAVAQPDRFRALLGLPAQYSGDASDLAVLAGKPIRLLVGERDTSWVTTSQATVAALASQGITAELEVVAGEDHVIALDPRDLLDWIDRALGR
jgi:dipeptidyl aminopeptidase/acylaminoacyl peptidase